MPPMEISVDGVAKLLSNLNIHKASGPENISARFLKECCDVVAPTVSQIVQLRITRERNSTLDD